MIVIDTSAIIAIVLKEPEGLLFLDRIRTADICWFGAANLLEARMVLYARDERNIQDLDLFLSRLGIRVEPVTATQSDIAFGAFRRYGKGTGHRAGLNFGDCFAYALAIERNAPLLFKGDDFIHTDVKPLQM